MNANKQDDGFCYMRFAYFYIYNIKAGSPELKYFGTDFCILLSIFFARTLLLWSTAAANIMKRIPHPALHPLGLTEPLICIIKANSSNVIIVPYEISAFEVIYD